MALWGAAASQMLPLISGEHTLLVVPPEWWLWGRQQQLKSATPRKSIEVFFVEAYVAWPFALTRMLPQWWTGLTSPCEVSCSRCLCYRHTALTRVRCRYTFLFPQSLDEGDTASTGPRGKAALHIPWESLESHLQEGPRGGQVTRLQN